MLKEEETDSPQKKINKYVRQKKRPKFKSMSKYLGLVYEQKKTFKDNNKMGHDASMQMKCTLLSVP